MLEQSYFNSHFSDVLLHEMSAKKQNHHKFITIEKNVVNDGKSVETWEPVKQIRLIYDRIFLSYKKSIRKDSQWKVTFSFL